MAPKKKPTRKDLAELDQKLVRQLQERARLVRQIAASDTGVETLLAYSVNPKRIASMVKKQPGPLGAGCLETIFRELASGIRASFQATRISFLGPLHSYSHLAALHRFGHSVELVPVRTIAAVFEEVSSHQADAGVVPIENSTDGRIVDTLDMFTRSPVKVCGEIPFRIHHNLLGRGKRQDVVEVCSKPQALSQCRDWLANHLPHAKLTATDSTTAAAERASTEIGVAAVASSQAGAEYGLKTLAKHIEDKSDNITRFAIIGPGPAAKTGNDKTSLMFELPHQPGAIADAMAIFKRNRLNLTWIESFPKSHSPNEYLFFVELEGYQNDLRVRRALASLSKKTHRIEVLGSYPKTAPVD